MTDPRLPDFVVLGAHRCAMRWLRFNLGEHPDIHVPPGPIPDPPRPIETPPP